MIMGAGFIGAVVGAIILPPIYGFVAGKRERFDLRHERE